MKAKRILSVLILLFSFLCVSAKDEAACVTSFMGVPVDGTISQMKKELGKKGFKYNKKTRCIQGMFNGMEVVLVLETYKDKICRLFACQVIPVDQKTIISNYNYLCRQFGGKPEMYEQVNKPEYVYEISPDESLDKYRDYEAVFLQEPSKPLKENRVVWFKIIRVENDYRIGFFYENHANKASGEDL